MNEPIGTSDFWYDLFDGGYLSPKIFFKDEDKIKEIEAAMKALIDYKEELLSSGLVEEI